MRRLLLFVLLCLGTAAVLLTWLEDGNLSETLGWENPIRSSDVTIPPNP